MKPYKPKIVFVLSCIISVLILVISGTGLTDDLYAHETHAWQIQCLGQDLINLALVTPCLMASAWLMLKGKLAGTLTWPGVMLYLIYTFAIYCFDVHFNDFFIEYCTVFGLSFYSLLYFLYNTLPEDSSFRFSNTVIKSVALYFLVLGFLFYSLWLSQLLPAVCDGHLPVGLKEVNLPTNPVHVLDLSVLLPLFLLASLLLFKKKTLGLRLAAGLLTFSFLMAVTILVLDMLQEDNSPMRVIFIILGLLSLTLLALLIRQYKALVENRHNTLWRK